MPAAKRPRGRPLKLTPWVHASVVHLLKQGYYLRHAAARVCLHEDTIANWIRRGEAGEKPYAAFARDVRQARAIDALRTVAYVVRAANRGCWEAAAWLLSHHHRAYGANVPALPGIDDDHVPVVATVTFYQPAASDKSCS